MLAFYILRINPLFCILSVLAQVETFMILVGLLNSCTLQKTYP